MRTFVWSATIALAALIGTITWTVNHSPPAHSDEYDVYLSSECDRLLVEAEGDDKAGDTAAASSKRAKVRELCVERRQHLRGK